MAEIGAYEAKDALAEAPRAGTKGGAFCHHQARATGGRAGSRRGSRRCQDQAGDRGCPRGAERLARRGIRLKNLLRTGENLRDLMHEGHRF